MRINNWCKANNSSVSIPLALCFHPLGTGPCHLSICSHSSAFRQLWVREERGAKDSMSLALESFRESSDLICGDLHASGAPEQGLQNCSVALYSI